MPLSASGTSRRNDNDHVAIEPARIAARSITPRPSHAVGGMRLDPGQRRAFVGTHELPLTTQLFDLLTLFLARRGSAISFEELATEVWAYTNGGGDHHFLHTAVYRLRLILREAGIEDMIEAVRGFGYRISSEAPVATAAIVGTGTATRAIAVFDPIDPDLRLLMVNEMAVELTGHSLEVLTDLPRAALNLWAPDERAQIDAVVSRALTLGVADTCGRQLRQANGDLLSVDIALSRLDLPQRTPLLLAEVTPTFPERAPVCSSSEDLLVHPYQQ